MKKGSQVTTANWTSRVDRPPLDGRPGRGHGPPSVTICNRWRCIEFDLVHGNTDRSVFNSKQTKPLAPYFEAVRAIGPRRRLSLRSRPSLAAPGSCCTDAKDSEASHARGPPSEKK
ncbi:hypothetical protein EVAR_61668_1 [Eumeta japonica]|uniref:Uncharacterized protein n=1 Tax=Eumeta variegata TaxID=151549 RepID=A0A4C1YQK0_EUMVA|nr:hypothetical protein EVAR_61668_1 [Eumeta japonica]